MKKIYLVILLIICCLFFAVPVLAVGIAVKPKEINLNVTVGRQTETEILVINISEEPAMYQVYPDALLEVITVTPADFRLEPNGNQIVNIIVKAKKPGRFATNISAIARPVGAGGLPTASGVKVPITIIASGILLWRLILGIFVGICLLIIFIVKLKKRSKSIIHKPNLLP